MEAAFAPARPPQAARVWREVLIPFASELEEEAEPLSFTVVGEIRAEFPDLFPDDDAFEENRAAGEQNIRVLARLIIEGGDPALADPPAAAIAYVREAVRRGVPIDAILRSLRLGHASFLAITLKRLRERTGRDDDYAQAAALVTAWSFGTIDRMSTQASVAHADERERWMRSSAATRAETIEAILERRDLDVHAAGTRLRYALDRHHVALLAWVTRSDEDSDTFSALEAAVTQAARRAGLESQLVQPLGLLATAAWLGSAGPIDPAAVDELRFDPAAAPGVYLAVGEPGAGLAGFRTSHRQAVEARRVATLTGRPSGTVTRYARVALSALATVDMDQARDFVASELGGLAADDDTSRRLAATVAAFLDEGSSHGRAARRLGIHENTVRYRIRQAEEVLGRAIGDRTLELRVALRLARVAGDAAQPQA